MTPFDCRELRNYIREDEAALRKVEAREKADSSRMQKTP